MIGYPALSTLKPRAEVRIVMVVRHRIRLMTVARKGATCQGSREAPLGFSSFVGWASSAHHRNPTPARHFQPNRNRRLPNCWDSCQAKRLRQPPRRVTVPTLRPLTQARTQ